MQQEVIISIPYAEFADDPVFHLLEKTMVCQQCDGKCQCIGFHEHELIYRCPMCDAIQTDKLPFTPLFAANFVEAMTIQHYEITCPYCHKTGHVVGGNTLDGLYFVCEDRCHNHLMRTIRRY